MQAELARLKLKAKQSFVHNNPIGAAHPSYHYHPFSAEVIIGTLGWEISVGNTN